MMRTLTLVVFCLALSAGAAFGQTTNLLITEYVEGSGNNKAVEIFNGTEDVIDLNNYSLELFANGTTIATVIALPAIDLQPGSGFVIGNPLADPALLALMNQTDANINFNGNDALTLVYGGALIVDSFGRVGEDPGTEWLCADGGTANHTLRRRSSICEGDNVADDVFDPCTQWLISPSNVFSGLGDHIADCGAVANAPTSWSVLKASYR